MTATDNEALVHTDQGVEHIGTVRTHRGAIQWVKHYPSGIHQKWNTQSDIPLTTATSIAAQLKGS